jgi:hypothetical protein
MQVPRISNYACAQPPSQECFVGQLSEDGQTLHVSAFDPLMGKAHEVRSVGLHPGGLHNWMPSPDGSRLVSIEFNALEGRIRLLSLKGDPDRDFVVKGCGWQVAFRFQSVTHQLDPVARGLGESCDASLGPAWWVANLGDRRYDERQQCMDDRQIFDWSLGKVQRVRKV